MSAESLGTKMNVRILITEYVIENLQTNLCDSINNLTRSITEDAAATVSQIMNAVRAS